MDKKYIKSEIQNLLEAITEQTEVISAYDLNIPQIELDIVKVNIRNLYEAYIQLDKLNRQVDKNMIVTPEISTPVEKITKEKIFAAPPVQEVNAKETVKTLREEIKPEQEVPKEVEPKVNEEKSKPEKKIVQPQPVYTSAKEETPVKPVEKNTKKSIDLFTDAATATMSDKFKNDTKSINDKMAQTKTEATLAGKINKVPITDLKTAIGINDKFRFVNELFEGNLSDYTDAISKLNAFDKIESALTLLESLAYKYKWDTGSDAFATLEELINRRYVK